jgi:hypothetical protein
MAKPHILVLAGDDASEVLSQAGFTIAGEDHQRRQTAAIVVDTRGDSGAKAGELVRSLKAALGPRAKSTRPAMAIKAEAALYGVMP